MRISVYLKSTQTLKYALFEIKILQNLGFISCAKFYASKITLYMVYEQLYMYIKLTKRKDPDQIANSCKRLSINQIAAGLRLLRYSHGFFLLSLPFQTHFL